MTGLDGLVTAAALTLAGLCWRARAQRRTLARRTVALRTLYDVGRALTSTLDFEALLKRIMDLSRQTIGSETASVMLTDESTGDLVLVCSHGLPDEVSPGARIARDGSVARWVFDHGDPAMLQGDPSHDDRFQIEGPRGHIRSALCVPLVGPRGPVGVLSLNNSVRAKAFTQEDLDLLTSIGTQGGIAVANARLHAHAEQANRQLTVTVDHLRNLKSCLTNMTSANLDESLSTMLDAAVEGTGAVSGNLTALDQGNTVHRIQSPRSVGAPPPFDPLNPDAAREQPSHTMLRVLMAEGESIGLLKLIAPSDGPGFNDDDREFVDALVEHASVVVFNSMLYQQAEAGRKALAGALDELREKQDQLIQSEKLAAIGQLAAKVCHEINNPLTAISGCSQLLRRRVNAEVSGPALEAYTRYLDTIASETARCSRITGDLLTYSRKQEPRLMPMDLHDTIHNALHLTTFQHPSHLQPDTSFDPGMPGIVADPHQVTQVLVNLFNNAAQVMPKGGPLRISTSVESLQGIDYACIRVHDAGPGLAEEDLDKVFSPFYTTRSTGTGLGLTISRGIVERHRGTLEIANADGGGAVATVLLPVNPAAAPRRPAEAAAS